MIGSVLRIRYEITQQIAEGPIFLSYAARDRVLGKDVCVRLLRQPFCGERAFVDRLMDVVKKFAASPSAWVEAIAEVDDHDGMPFLLGPLSTGMPLTDRIRRLAPFSVPVSIGMATSLCKGLEVLHKDGLVHGDVGSHNAVALADGSARLQLAGVWEAYSASETAGSVALPSMAPYLAPEVSAGSMPTPASDVYAVGVLLYELVTGRAPYVGESAVATAMKHATSPTPHSRTLNPSIPLALDEMILKAMSKDADRRYSNAGLLLSDLRVLQDALRFGKSLTWPISSGSPTAAAPEPSHSAAPRVATAKPPRQRDRTKEPRDVPLWLTIPAALIAGALIFALVMYVVFYLRPPQTVSVPNLKNMLIEDARRLAASDHLSIRVVGQEPNDKYPVNTVIAMKQAPGEKVRERFALEVVVSAGSEVVAVPDLTGLTVDGAKTALTQLKLPMDDRIEKVPSDRARGLVVGQSPASGQQIDRQTKVRIQVSNGVAPTAPNTAATDSVGQPPVIAPNTVPSPTGAYMYTLKIHLVGITAPVLLRVDITDDEGTRTVFEGRRRPAETVVLHARGLGESATFLVYYDGAQVTEVVKQAQDGVPDTGGAGR